MLHYQESDYAEKIRYYSPNLEQLDKDIIYNGFQKYLDKLNIHERGLYYLEGIVRSLVKDDSQKYQLARKAYVSMLRAYLLGDLVMQNTKINILLPLKSQTSNSSEDVLE